MSWDTSQARRNKSGGGRHYQVQIVVTRGARGWKWWLSDWGTVVTAGTAITRVDAKARAREVKLDYIGRLRRAAAL